MPQDILFWEMEEEKYYYEQQVLFEDWWPEN